MAKAVVTYKELADAIEGRFEGESFEDLTDFIFYLKHHYESRISVNVVEKDVAHIRFGKESVLIDDIIDKAVDQALRSVTTDIETNCGTYDESHDQLETYIDDSRCDNLHIALAIKVQSLLNRDVDELVQIVKKGHITNDDDTLDSRKKTISKLLGAGEKQK